MTIPDERFLDATSARPNAQVTISMSGYMFFGSSLAVSDRVLSVRRPLLLRHLFAILCMHLPGTPSRQDTIESVTGVEPSHQSDPSQVVEDMLERDLAEAGVDPVPTQGEETTEGLSLGLAWPQLGLVVDLHFSDEDRLELTPQWTLVRPELEAVVAALATERP